MIESNSTPAPIAPAPLMAPTAEQIELERTRLERARIEQQLEETRQKKSEGLAEHKKLVSGETFDAALASCSITFHDAQIVRQLAESECHLTFDDEGQPSAVVDGEKTSDLNKVFRHIAKQRPFLTDRRTFRDDDPKPPQMVKSQMSTAQKVDYINRYGEEAFTKLPMRPTRMVEVKYREDYTSLPMASKMALIEKFGADYFAKLPARPKGFVAEQHRGF